MNAFRLVQPDALTDLNDTFRRWLGEHYDLQIPHACLAALAVHHCLPTSTTVWLQIVGGSGGGKTETLTAVGGSALIVSTVTSSAALLSGSPQRERTKSSTGGILRQIGASGVIVWTDFTAVLSLHHETTKEIIGTLRAVHDGRFERPSGADGGKVLSWQGRVTMLSGSTSAYDDHQHAISQMGDRWLLLRMRHEDGDADSIMAQVSMNIGQEGLMHRQLRAAADAVLATTVRNFTDDMLRSSDAVQIELNGLAKLVARMRSTVSRDYKGEPLGPHMPEVPSRVRQQIGALFIGARAIGLDDNAALRLVRRVAHDSVPADRRIVLLAAADMPGANTAQITRGTYMSYTKVDYALRELHMHGVLTREGGGRNGVPWSWYVASRHAETVATLRAEHGEVGQSASL